MNALLELLLVVLAIAAVAGVLTLIGRLRHGKPRRRGIVLEELHLEHDLPPDLKKQLDLAEGQVDFQAFEAAAQKVKGCPYCGAAEQSLERERLEHTSVLGHHVYTSVVCRSCERSWEAGDYTVREVAEDGTPDPLGRVAIHQKYPVDR